MVFKVCVEACSPHVRARLCFRTTGTQKTIGDKRSKYKSEELKKKTGRLHPARKSTNPMLATHRQASTRFSQSSLVADRLDDSRRRLHLHGFDLVASGRVPDHRLAVLRQVKAHVLGLLGDADALAGGGLENHIHRNENDQRHDERKDHGDDNAEELDANLLGVAEGSAASVGRLGHGIHHDTFPDLDLIRCVSEASCGPPDTSGLARMPVRMPPQMPPMPCTPNASSASS